MTKKKQIVDAKNDSDGNITAVKLEGNKTFTPINKAIEMAKNGKVDAIVVKPKGGNPYLRSKPDGKKKNNLDYLADN